MQQLIDLFHYEKPKDHIVVASKMSAEFSQTEMLSNSTKGQKSPERPKEVWAQKIDLAQTNLVSLAHNSPP